MCGIGGFWDHNGPNDPRIMENILREMANSQKHRGPDSDGFFMSSEEGIGFCHRRLSIIDLSETGSQPMKSRDGRWIVVYNGEWYNHRQIRDSLGNRRWRGSSDTETLVECLSYFGIEDTLPKMNGMFAFSAWDSEKKELHLVRDRFGIKPLYFGQQDGLTVFSSELSGIFSQGNFKMEIEPAAVLSFLRLNYVPSPLCICKDIIKLPPGYHAKIGKKGEVVQRQWYDLTKELEKSEILSLRGFEEEVIWMEEQIERSVSMRMLSDVPLGSLLSGGIDSSLVSLFMQKGSSSPISTFSIGFAESEFDESQYAKKVSELIGSQHNELNVSSEDVMDLIPHMPGIFSEPLGDSSQIPTYIVSRLAREQVTVALGGDGGDEVFGGYMRYPQSLDGSRIFSGPFSIFRDPSVTLLNTIPPSLWDLILGWLPRNLRPRYPGDWVHRWSRRAKLRRPEDRHADLVEQWIEQIEKGSGRNWERCDILAKSDPGEQFADLDRLQIIDMKTWMVDDILAKVDIAAMACGLEVRVPLLDHNVVEGALSLSPSSRYSRRTGGKWILKKILSRHLPNELFNRPKQGFVLPIEKWIRGPLKEWARLTLTEENLISVGITNPQDYIRILEMHIEGRGEYATPIWTLLSLLSWKEKWLPKSNVNSIY